MILSMLEVQVWKVAKRGWMLLLLLITSLSMLAGPVSESEARQKAFAFLQKHGRSADALSQNVKRGRSRAARAEANYYVFNLGQNDGFVIVSGDDRTTAILGYADHGTIGDDMPDGLRYLLAGYEEQIELLGDDEGDKAATRANDTQLRRSGHSEITPMITTKWYQAEPYNNTCPTIDDERTLTGCVATSLAQLMYYHYVHNGFAASSTAIPGYTTTTKNKAKESISLNVADLPAFPANTTFDWTNMTTTYTESSTGPAADAVAQLMLYCGTALQMKYGLDASSAFNASIPYVMKTFFGYDGGIQACHRRNHSYSAWVNMIYSELADARPVILGGQSSNGGHSFVCDGYKYDSEADYFHINWGWGGSGDGYFLLSVLSPYNDGVGNMSKLDGFSYDQDAVIGIQKPVEGNADYCIALEGLRFSSPHGSLSSNTFNRVSADEAFTGISINTTLCSYKPGTNHYDYALLLVNNNGIVVDTLAKQDNKEFLFNKDGIFDDNVSVPSSVINGTYYIKVMTRENGTSDWQECYDGDSLKLTATINGNSLTINVPIPANVSPSVVLSAVSGDKMTGHEHTVTATITGGNGSFNGDVLLRLNGTTVLGTTLNLIAHEAKEMQFSFRPNEVGSYTIALYGNGAKLSNEVTLENVIFALDNNMSNRIIIDANKDKTTSAKLYGRTLYKDGKWNTICLPFDVTIDGSPLEGAVARTLSSSSYSNGELTLTFTDPVPTLEAGKPYIIKWAVPQNYVAYNGENATTCSDIVNPEFTSVTIKDGYNNVVTDYVDFRGYYSHQEFTSDYNSVLFVGVDNILFWPREGATLGACRGYFKLKNGLTGGSINAARMVFNVAGIYGTEITDDTDSTNAWYTLDGRKLANKPTAKGVYIHGGKKIVVK